MEQKTVYLVQESFKKVLPIADTAVEIFYDKLFLIDPNLKQLFPQNEQLMHAQRNKLRDMLASAVNGLNNLKALIPILQGLGRRHVDYNVEKSHYDTVGLALLQALEVDLGDEFTPEVKDAWAEVYGVIDSVMTEAAYED